MFSNVHLNEWVVVLWNINKGQRVKTNKKGFENTSKSTLFPPLGLMGNVTYQNINHWKKNSCKFLFSYNIPWDHSKPNI